MCGIFLGEQKDGVIMALIENRGRDIKNTIHMNGFILYSSVLSIRNKIIQPIQTDNFSFLYNGEIYNEASSDTIFIKDTTEAVLLQYKYDYIKIQKISMDIYSRINKSENELALVMLFKDYILFFKDDIGRKSLGYTLDKLLISSLGYENEVDCLYLYIYDINKKNIYKVLKESDYVYHHVANYHRIAHLINSNSYYGFLKHEKPDVNFEKRIEKCSIEDLDRSLYESVKKRLVEGNLVVLFSGGVDSNIIVLYLILTSKPNQKIILINSSLCNSQDRKNAKTSHEKFKKLFSGRIIELIVIDLNIEVIKNHKKHLEKLIYPKKSKMDLNIAVVLYFGSKEARKYSKVCYLGSGADEIFCGYNKYKEDDFRDKMFFDLFTISYHNITRDDRCISDNNIEPRFPFLDTNIIQMSYSIENEEIRKKNILRRIFSKHGLSEFSTLKKVAMQYGSGMCKIEKYL